RGGRRGGVVVPEGAGGGRAGGGGGGRMVAEEERARRMRERADPLCRREKIAAEGRLQAELEQTGPARQQQGGERGGCTLALQGVDDRVEGWGPVHGQRAGGRRVGRPRPGVFFRSGVPVMPRPSAALSWLPPHRPSTISMSGRSTALISFA